MPIRKLSGEVDNIPDVHVIDFIHKNKLLAGVANVWRKAFKTVDDARVGFKAIFSIISLLYS